MISSVRAHMERQRLLVHLLFLVASSDGAETLVCKTSVNVRVPERVNGTLEIELWPHTAPVGVGRVRDLVAADFFTELPFFQALPHQIMFGLQPDAEKQRHWDRAGDIADDAVPHVSPPAGEGLLCFSGDPGKGADSRSTLLFFTLGTKHLMSNRKTPWEVPLGRVTHATLEVLRSIYTEYGDEPQVAWLNASNTRRPAGAPDAQAYWERFPKLDRFRSCQIVHDSARASGDPNLPRHDEL